MLNWLRRNLRRLVSGKPAQMDRTAMIQALGRMSLVERKQLFGITFGVPGAETWTFATDWATGRDLLTDDQFKNSYAIHPTIATAVQTIAEDAASIPWELQKLDANNEPTDEIVTYHPIEDVWRRANPVVGSQLFTATYIWDLLEGESFWYFPDLVLPVKQMPELSAITGGELWLLDPRQIKHKISKDRKQVLWFLEEQQGKQVPLDGERLTHFKRWNPYNPLRGLSKVEAVMVEMQGDHHASKWNDRFFAEQNAVPTGLIIPSMEAMEETDEDQRRDILRAFNEAHSGTGRSVGMLPGGWDYKDVGATQREMDFKSLREYSREQILGMFGLPPFRAGVLDRANYANSRQQDEVYWYGTIHRFLTRVQNTINYDFFPKMNVEGVHIRPKWDVVKALVDDLKAKADTARIMHQLGVPLAEINSRLEMGFHLDGVRGVDEPVRPINMIPVEIVEENPPWAGGKKPQGKPDDKDEEEEQEDEKPPEKHLVKVSSYPKDEQWRDKRWRRTIGQLGDIEKRFDKRIRRHMEKLRSETIDKLHSLKGWLLVSGIRQDDKKWQQVEEIFEELNDQEAQEVLVSLGRPETRKDVIDELMFDDEEADRELIRAANPLYAEALRRGGEGLMYEVGVGLNFDMTDPVVQAKLAEITMRMKYVNETLERKIREVLVLGIEQGETLEEMATKINAEFGLGLRRSRTIARTETGVAFSVARNLAMRQAGIKKHEWLSARDPAVRDSHVAEDGNIVPIGTAFPVTKLLYPGDPAGAAREIINCRCIALPVTE